MKHNKNRSNRASDEEVVNIFDRASQLGMQLDPHEFFRCTLYRLHPDLVWGEWLKSHMVIGLKSSERRCDNIAKLVSQSGSRAPWACIAEAQGYDDTVFNPRLLLYKAGTHITVRHGPRGRDRYPVMGLVLNLGDKPMERCLEWLPPMVDASEPSPLYPNLPLTGSGSTSPSENPLGVQQLVGTSMRVWVINWRQVDGKKYLEAISAGKMGLCMLPWFPMTIGGGDPDLMKEWKRLAQQESDHNTRTEYGSPALVFSEKGQCQNQWLPFLEGWNVEQSVIGNMWLKQGEERGESKGALKQTRTLLTRTLTKRFPNESTADFVARIQAEQNLDTLSHWFDLAMGATTFQHFIAAVEFNGNP